MERKDTYFTATKVVEPDMPPMYVTAMVPHRKTSWIVITLHNPTRRDFYKTSEFLFPQSTCGIDMLSELYEYADIIKEACFDNLRQPRHFVKAFDYDKDKELFLLWAKITADREFYICQAHESDVGGALHGSLDKEHSLLFESLQEIIARVEKFLKGARNE